MLWHNMRKAVLQVVDIPHREYKTVRYILNQFEETKNSEHLIRLYTLETPFYTYVAKHGDAFYMELLIGLTIFQERFFVGCACRGVQLNTVDLNSYLWAWQHLSSFIETCTIFSTSANRKIAERFGAQNSNAKDKNATIFKFDFTERCETAIDLRSISG
jgi:hypothetical protein